MSTDNDSDFDSENHSLLLRKIAQNGRQSSGKEKKKEEKEKEKGRGVGTSDLLAGIQSRKALDALKVQVNVASTRSATLHAPVHKAQRETFQRCIEYEKARKESKEWKEIVAERRLAEQLRFPLNSPHFRLQTVAQSLHSFTPRTKLETESARILNGSKHNLTNKDAYTEAEKEMLQQMTLAEAKEKCAEMQKLRALMSYQEAKFKRQKKIKSKKYHRILKRQKRRKWITECEDLMSKDGHKAKDEWAARLEKDRILERATLKHRSGGKTGWAKRQAAREGQIRAQLRDTVRLGRDLATKASPSSEDSDSDQSKINDNQVLTVEAGESVKKDETVEFLKGNPWLDAKLKRLRHEDTNGTGQHHVVSDETFDKIQSSNTINANVCNNYFEGEHLKTFNFEATTSNDREVTKKKKGGIQKNLVAETIVKCKNSKTRLDRPPVQQTCSQSEKVIRKQFMSERVALDSLFENFDRKIVQSATEQLIKPGKAKKKRIKGEQNALSVQESGRQSADSRNGLSNNTVDEEKVERKEDEWLRVDTLLQEAGKKETTLEEWMEGESGEKLLAAAFEDDDVIGQFKEDKNKSLDMQTASQLDLTLPGWGTWTGPHIPSRPSRLLMKAAAPKRKDHNLPGVIISDMTDKAIKKHKMNCLPFPYTSLDDYEAVMRQPIGREWNAEIAHKCLTEPAIVTKMGTIIRPMDKESTLRAAIS